MSQEHLHYNTQADINGTVINKCWTIRQATVIVIILLHSLITINFAANWSWTHFAFIKNAQSFWTVYLFLVDTNAVTWVMDISASISTILADLYMVCNSSGCYSHQFTIGLTLDLVLLDGLGPVLACCSASNIFPGFCNRYGVSHLYFSCS